MNSEVVLNIILIILVADFVLERTLDWLNNKAISPTLPPQAKGIYDEEQYAKMLKYEKETGRFGLLTSTISFLVTFALLYSGFFGWFDGFIRFTFGSHPIYSGLLFFGILGLASDLLTTPFSIYGTFVIEAKYGFNKTTAKTYVLDKIKGWVLGGLIGGLLYAAIVWLYLQFGEQFWIFAWVLIAGFSLIMNMFYASWILPLFNKLSPMEEGSLRDRITQYCAKINYPLTGLFVMDGSKRSTKANAFFSGLGKKKKIVLFDTLIEKLKEEEVEAVLAHEVGHYKKKHIQTSTVISILSTGVTLYIFSLILGNEMISGALGTNQPSFHISLIAFGFLFSPISLVTGLLGNVLSRKNEFEADAFAKETSDSKALSGALKTLAVDSLSNLTPHKAYVFFYYSHPPLLERLRELEG